MFVAAWQDTEGLTVRQVSEKTNSEKKLCDIPSMDLLFSVYGFAESFCFLILIFSYFGRVLRWNNFGRVSQKPGFQKVLNTTL